MFKKFHTWVLVKFLPRLKYSKYIYPNDAIRNQTQCCVLGYAKYNQARTSPARVAGFITNENIVYESMTLHKKSTAKFLRIRATFHDSNIEDVKDICREHLINISFLPVLCFFWILRKTVMCMILYQELNFPKHFLQNYYFLTWANRVNYFERMTWLQLRPGSEYL